MVVVRHALVILVAGTLGYSGAAWGQALSSNEPSGRVGRLAFTQGTVSYHDSQRTDWEPATINQPLSTGDAVWTEPGAHSEVSIAGTRVRMDGATQLDMATLDDKQTRLQVDQGRVDIKTLSYDASQPYEIVTPRGVASLQQQGDYYVEAGSTQDPTRLGVRQGAAQFQAPDGRTMAVRAGEVAEISGDGSTMQLNTIKAPPPPMPQYWAQRDRVVAYEQPPQYLSPGITGYEDLNYYGTWNNDPEYGQVWSARNVPAGWSPYSTGRWVHQPIYGWTWVDEQPWGFAPYHYGRWANRNNRWFWVPPERSQRPVYAPALVAFIGGTELGIALGVQNRRPVGWFPLGPREVYVPPYYTNRDYYRRINIAARVQDQILEQRWERQQRHEAFADQSWQNRRFATVVPAEALARSQRVETVKLRVDASKLAAAPVAAVAVPPSPTVSVRAVQADNATARDATPDRAQRPGEARKPDEPRTGATAQDRTNAREARAEQVQEIKPEPQAKKSPGPQVVSRSAVTTNTDAKAGTDAKASTDGKAGADAKAALPALAPRNAKAPPPPQIKGEREPQQATAPASRPNAPAKPGKSAKPGEPQAKPAEPHATSRPDAPPRPGEPNTAKPDREPGQANLPTVRDRNERRPEAPKADQTPQARTTPNATAPTPQPPKPNEAPKPPQASTTPAPHAAPQPKEQPHAQPAPQPRQATEPQPAPQQHQTPPAPQPQPKPRESQAAPPQQQPAPQPQRQAAPQPQPRESHAAPPPQQAAPQPQRQAAPAPQPQHQAAPAPQPQHQAAPQQAQAPHPQPQAQPQQKPQKSDDKKSDDKK